MMEYAEFLASKRLICPAVGREVPESALHPEMFKFQKALCRWALRKGRAALFTSTGTGKTLVGSLEWARLAADRTLVLAPLAVAQQTVREGERWGVPVTYARSEDQAAPHGITITNYEMLGRFAHARYGAVVCDESGIMKNFEGRTRQALIEAFRRTPARLCCTATPAPNDFTEIGNHAEFLGIMTRVEMLATFFVHDADGWRLKGHAREPFYEWLASWSMSLVKPSDIGYDDTGYDLPELTIEPIFVPADYAPPGQLFSVGLKGIGERAAVRRGTVDHRVKVAADLINSDRQPWIAWVGLDEEGRRLAKLIPDCVLVEGSQSPEIKAAALMRFVNGEVRVLITKGKMGGHGLNLQHCARMVFVGMNDSWEMWFQCIRRCWRFGQQRPVIAYAVLTEPEAPIYQNVLRKEEQADAMRAALIRHVRRFEERELAAASPRIDYAPSERMRLPQWLEGGSLCKS